MLFWMPNRPIAGKKYARSAILFVAISAAAAWAQAHDDADVKKDILRHKAMAAAHSAAAQCLESGKKYDDCIEQLQNACKGLGIGKTCGMRHEH